MRAWRMSLRRTKSAIISWHGSNEPQHDKNQQNEYAPSEDSDQSVWSESLLCAHWVAKDPSFLHADSEDSESSLGAQPFCWFCHVATQMFYLLDVPSEIRCWLWQWYAFKWIFLWLLKTCFKITWINFLKVVRVTNSNKFVFNISSGAGKGYW